MDLKHRISIILVFLLFFSCQKGNKDIIVNTDGKEGTELSIFFINDPHARLANFAKIKHIVDEAKEETNVLLVAAGDIFSGSPYVDQYEPKGYPMIDVMNQTGFDIGVIGNHEFDYGLDILQDRIEQSEFPWICANVDAKTSALSQPEPYKTLTVGDLKVTFLGLVETNGHPTKVIPATHPWRVTDVAFERYWDVAGQYSTLKEDEEADVYVALTHLGLYSDQILAENYPYFDLVIGGHSNNLSTSSVNGIPTLMAGNNLSHLGRVDLRIDNGDVSVTDIQLIDLNAYSSFDSDLADVIATYENNEALDEVVGNATSYHDRTELGCFYTTALKEYMNVDISFQNGGGIRADINEGDVTKLEIFTMDPFNNGSVVFSKTTREIKDFFIETGTGLHVTGVSMEVSGDDIIMRDEQGEIISDETSLTIGINDYIPAVHEAYFELADADIKELTTAESIINYLKTMNSTVDHEGCDHYFRY